MKRCKVINDNSCHMWKCSSCHRHLLIINNIVNGVIFVAILFISPTLAHSPATLFWISKSIVRTINITSIDFNHMHGRHTIYK